MFCSWHIACTNTQSPRSLLAAFRIACACETQSQFGSTALISAVSLGKTDFVRMLIENGVDANAKDKVRNISISQTLACAFISV
jgi:hypothetical protein